MKESFMVQFYNKAEKAHKKGADCYKAGDYLNFLSNYLEAGYYQTLGYAVNGLDHSIPEITGITETLDYEIMIKQEGKDRATQSLKKMGKLDRQPEIKTVIEQFISELSTDFIALETKSTEIDHLLSEMSIMEKMQKKLTNNVTNEIDPIDRLFMEDKTAMAILNRLKSPSLINKLIKDVLKILQ